MISTLQYFHEKGYIHRNLKPETLLLDSNRNIYISDFNYAMSWRDKKIRNAFSSVNKVPNDLYCSIHSHTSGPTHVFSRGTDMESVGYILLHLVHGSLPWENSILMQKCKREILLERMKDIPREFIIYIMYCRGLTIDEKPNYQFLKELFGNLAERNGYNRLTRDVIRDMIELEIA